MTRARDSRAVTVCVWIDNQGVACVDDHQVCIIAMMHTYMHAGTASQHQVKGAETRMPYMGDGCMHAHAHLVVHLLRTPSKSVPLNRPTCMDCFTARESGLGFDAV